MLRLDNRAARRIFIHRHALSGEAPGRLDRARLLDLIDRLGFVQVDSIRTLERAHHMILFARHQTYRKRDLAHLLERDRTLFENWTHDASIIPTRFFPWWRTACAHRTDGIETRWKGYGREGFLEQAEPVLAEIARRGPLKTAHLGEDEYRSSGGWWDWNPSKTALEYLWRTGRLCVSRRENFHKVYDLTENVIPAEHLAAPPDRAALIDWACGAALDRLGFATTGEIAAFWALISPAEAKDWAARQNALVEVEVECADGALRRCLARPGIAHETPPDPPGRVRALSPFDPMLRDRKRARRLFGFDYTIEVFVPAARRKYGYYVFPLMEGDAMVGRIDMKADRKAGALVVSALWLEPKIRPSKGRLARLEAELARQRRFAGLEGLRFEDGWLRG